MHPCMYSLLMMGFNCYFVFFVRELAGLCLQQQASQFHAIYGLSSAQLGYQNICNILILLTLRLKTQVPSEASDRFPNPSGSGSTILTNDRTDSSQRNSDTERLNDASKYYIYIYIAIGVIYVASYAVLLHKNSSFLSIQACIIIDNI